MRDDRVEKSPPQSAVATVFLNLVSQVGSKGLLQASCFIGRHAHHSSSGSRLMLVGSKKRRSSRTAQGRSSLYRSVDSLEKLLGLSLQFLDGLIFLLLMSEHFISDIQQRQDDEIKG